MQMATLPKALALEEQLQQASFAKAKEELEDLKTYAKAQVQNLHGMFTRNFQGGAPPGFGLIHIGYSHLRRRLPVRR